MATGMASESQWDEYVLSWFGDGQDALRGMLGLFICEQLLSGIGAGLLTISGFRQCVRDVYLACFLLLFGIIVLRSFIATVALLPRLGEEFFRDCGCVFYRLFPGISWLLACWSTLWIPIVGALAAGCPGHSNGRIQIALSVILVLNSVMISTSTLVFVVTSRQARAESTSSLPNLLSIARSEDGIGKDSLPLSTKLSFQFVANAPEHICLGPCSICLQEYEMGERLLLLKCGHIHHEACIRRWFWSGAPSCPMRCTTCETKRSADKDGTELEAAVDREHFVVTSNLEVDPSEMILGSVNTSQFESL